VKERETVYLSIEGGNDLNITACYTGRYGPALEKNLFFLFLFLLSSWAGSVMLGSLSLKF
jgi:hypothetical protein